MKKIRLVIIAVLASMALGSCSLFEKNPDVIENEPQYTQIENSITDVVDKVEKACIGILCNTADGSSSGSGVIYKKENGYYYSITNHHVIEGATSVKAYLGGSTYYNCEVIGSDSKNDLAVVRFKNDLFSGDLATISLDETEDLLKSGQTVIAIGCPLGLTFFNSVSTGVISRVSNSENRIQHTAAINPGNSGGGLFNLSGRLIGINVEKMTTTTTSTGEIAVEGIGFSITMDLVKSVVASIERKQTTIDRPVLGVSVNVVNRFISNNDLEYLPDTLEQGVIIQRVDAHSKADIAGIIEKDILYKINDSIITKVEDVSAILNTLEAGDTIKVSVIRLTSEGFRTIEMSITF